MAARLPLSVLTTYFVVLIFAVSDANDRLPTFWNEAPSSLADYPLASNSSASRVINPWVYTDRLGLYKILITTTTPHMRYAPSSNVSNILFGLPSQFGWQFDSNRLFTKGTQQISTDSWWASANYYLSVIPFLAAVDAGVIQQGSFVLVPRADFCASSVECFRQVPEAMTKWRLFFANLLQANYCKDEPVNDRLVDRCFLAPMWDAHVASIGHALPLIAAKLPLLPSVNEQRFGLGWAHLVDFIAMARENTDLSNVLKYQDDFLPSRVLRTDDRPPHCPDLPKSVNEGLELLFSIRVEWFPKLLQLWRTATCNYEARKDAQRVIETAAVSKSSALAYYSEAVVKAHLYGCDANSTSAV